MMLKTVMFASAIALSAPAFAQDMPTPPQDPATSSPTQDQTTPVAPTDAPAAPTTAQTTAPTAPQGEPIPGSPVTAPAADTAQTTTDAAPAPQTQPAPAPAEHAATTATADPATPVTGQSQIAQVVNTEFPTYDKNGDGNLDKTEFGAWMVALKTASDPATKAGDPATVKWVSGAFASADTDKSAQVSKVELTTYLSQGSAAE